MRFPEARLQQSKRMHQKKEPLYEKKAKGDKLRRQALTWYLVYLLQGILPSPSRVANGVHYSCVVLAIQRPIPISFLWGVVLVGWTKLANAL